MLAPPPSSIQSPCHPIHALLRRFDVAAGSNSGVLLPRVGPPPACGRLELLLFPCRLGDPARPIGWPPASRHECTVMVNESYVTDGIPRCPTRSASHRTLAGLSLSPYLRMVEGGGVDAAAPLKIVITSKDKWEATFLLAWCRVIDVHTVVEQTIARLLPSESLRSQSKVSSSLSDDDSYGGHESDVDVDSGWVDDDKDDVLNSGHANKKKNQTLSASLPLGLGEVGDDLNFVEDSEAVVTLRCPLSYQRMTLAGKGNNCAHLACFDVATYLESSLLSNAWNCPICDGPVFMNDVHIDRTVQGALDGLSREEDTVVLFGAGHREWRAVTPKEHAASVGESNETSDPTRCEARKSSRGEGQEAALQFCAVDDDSDDGDGRHEADTGVLQGQSNKRFRFQST